MGAAVSGPWGPRPYTLGEFIVNHALNPLATFINVHLLPPPAPSSTTNVSPNSPIRVEGLVANFTLDAGDPLIVLLGHWQRIDLNTLVPWQLMSHLMSANEAVTHEIQREDGLYGPFGLAYATPLNLLLRSAEESGLYPYLQGRRWFRSQGNRRYFSYPGGGEADFELRVNNSGRMPVFLVEIKRPDKAPTQYLHDIVDAIRGGGGFTLEYSEDEGRFWIVNREGYLEEDEFWLWTARTLAQVRNELNANQASWLFFGNWDEFILFYKNGNNIGVSDVIYRDFPGPLDPRSHRECLISPMGALCAATSVFETRYV